MQGKSIADSEYRDRWTLNGASKRCQMDPEDRSEPPNWQASFLFSRLSPNKAHLAVPISPVRFLSYDPLRYFKDAYIDALVYRQFFFKSKIVIYRKTRKHRDHNAYAYKGNPRKGRFFAPARLTLTSRILRAYCGNGDAEPFAFRTRRKGPYILSSTSDR